MRTRSRSSRLVLVAVTIVPRRLRSGRRDRRRPSRRCRSARPSRRPRPLLTPVPGGPALPVPAASAPGAGLEPTEAEAVLLGGARLDLPGSAGRCGTACRSCAVGRIGCVPSDERCASYVVMDLFDSRADLLEAYLAQVAEAGHRAPAREGAVRRGCAVRGRLHPRRRTAGERWRSAAHAGWTRIGCPVLPRDPAAVRAGPGQRAARPGCRIGSSGTRGSATRTSPAAPPSGARSRSTTRSSRRPGGIRRSDAYSGRCASNSPSAATTPCARCSPWPARPGTGCCPRAGSPTRCTSRSASCPRSSPTSSGAGWSRRAPGGPAATAWRATRRRSACSR